MQSHQPALTALEGTAAFIRSRYARKFRSVRCFDIEDFLQEVRRTILRSRLSGDYSPFQWHVCVLKIAERQFRKQMSRLAGKEASEFPFSSLTESTSEEALGVEDSSIREILDCAQRLSEFDQKIFDFLLKGYSAAEISRLTSIPESSVARNIARVRTKLGSLINESDDR